MLEIERLAQLGSAVKIAGGVRAVANRAGLDPSNTSKFLRQARGLSSDNVRHLETVLGRPGGHADNSSVIHLVTSSVGDDLARALAWYFPVGAEVARASWTGIAIENIKKIMSLRFTPEIYGFKDEFGCRVVLVLPAGLVLPGNYFAGESPDLKWYGGDRAHAVLEIDENFKEWLQGSPTPAAFDAAWPTSEFKRSPEDLLEHVRRLGITWAEAIRRVSYN